MHVPWWRRPFAPVAPAARPDYVPALDGLRGIAVLLVLLYHAGFPFGDGGWLGVDVFFVLSGFLITERLCDEHRTRGSISFPAFWRRRFARLLPAYYFYLAGITVAFLLTLDATHPSGEWSPGGYLAALWCHAANYLPLGGIWDYQRLTIHLWSLSLEEQFYLVWPVVFVALRPTRRLIAFLVVAALVSVAIRQFPALHLSLGNRLHTRGLGMVWGCLMALTLFVFPGTRAWFSRRSVWLTACLCIAGVLFLWVTVATRRVHAAHISDDDIHRGLVPAFGFIMAPIVAYLWLGRSGALVRVLSARSLAWVGKLSYGVYLYHVLVQQLVWSSAFDSLRALSRPAAFAIRFAMYVGLTLLVAWTSFMFLERPLRAKIAGKARKRAVRA